MTVESQFIGEGKVHIMSKFQSIFWLDGVRIGVRTPRGSIYYRKLLESLCDFVEEQSAESLEIPMIPLVYHSDAFIRARKRLRNFVILSKRSLGAEKRLKVLPHQWR